MPANHLYEIVTFEDGTELPVLKLFLDLPVYRPALAFDPVRDDGGPHRVLVPPVDEEECGEVSDTDLLLRVLEHYHEFGFDILAADVDPKPQPYGLLVKVTTPERVYRYISVSQHKLNPEDVLLLAPVTLLREPAVVG